jgi:hypothetical protein
MATEPANHSESVLVIQFSHFRSLGTHHVQIYNDGYWPICGAEHPLSMGQDFTECWASAWPAIGEAFESALAREARYLENQRMFLDRHGYLEETCFTFSFSPIHDESGDVGGLFHPVIEVTAKMVNDRRMQALRAVTACAAGAHSLEEALGWIYAGYKMTIFSTAEEQQREPLEIGGKVLFYPDLALRTAGGDVSVVAPWQSYVLQDRELISGQNPFSDQALLKLLLPALEAKRTVNV